MDSENEPKEMVKSCIDLANITKELKDKKEKASIQQELERLFLGTRGRGKRGGGSSQLHWAGAAESSASTKTDTNTSFAIQFTTKQTVAQIRGSQI